MRNLGLSAVLALVILSCQKDKNVFVINGSVELPDSTKVYLKKVDEQNNPKDVQETFVIGNHFKFSGIVDTVDVHYLLMDKVRGNFPLVIEPGNIHVNVKKDSLPFSDLGGTKTNDEFHDYILHSRPLGKRIQAMSQEFQTAVIQGDTTKQQVLREEYNQVMEEMKKYERGYIREHPDSFLTLMLLERYLTSRSYPIDSIRAMFDKLDDKYKKTPIGFRLEKAFGLTVGSNAKPFEAPDTEGNTLSLEKAMGKVTIIDFWASWCGPCRQENPNVVRLYEKYHDKGLNILGVSLDKDKQKWLEAIEKDGLNWMHVSNLKQWNDPVAQLYDVKAIPATFILDADGKIVAKDLRGADLEAKVAGLLD